MFFIATTIAVTVVNIREDEILVMENRSEAIRALPGSKENVNIKHENLLSFMYDTVVSMLIISKYYTSNIFGVIIRKFAI